MKTLTKAEQKVRRSAACFLGQKVYWFVGRDQCNFQVMDHGNTYEILVPTNRIRKALETMDRQLKEQKCKS